MMPDERFHISVPHASSGSSIGGPSPYIMPDDQFHIFVCHGAFEPASDMLLYPFAHTSLGSVSSSMHSFSTSTWKASCFGASEFLFLNLHVRVSKEFLFPYPTDQALFTRLTPGTTDGTNVEAYLRGPLGLGKRASNVRIIWFSFGSFGSVSFGSSAESKNVVQLRILWRWSGHAGCSRGLLWKSASTWCDLLGISLGLIVVGCYYLLLISRRRYTSSAMKKLIAKLPTLTAPKKEEELMVYLSAADEAVSVVLLVERDERQTPIHYVSQTLQGIETNYPPIEKLTLALVHAARRLRRYFQGHIIKVITDKPISQILNNREATGRLTK
ncbi:reverse transcriptase domain-containing protein [Tanacetum coccineum]